MHTLKTHRELNAIWALLTYYFQRTMEHTNPNLTDCPRWFSISPFENYFTSSQLVSAFLYFSYLLSGLCIYPQHIFPGIRCSLTFNIFMT